MKVSTQNVWAEQRLIGGNRVRQLLVPMSDDLILKTTDSSMAVAGPAGEWPAIRAGSTTSAAQLTACLPTVDRASVRATWCGPRHLLDPATVLESFHDAITFRRPGEPGALRRAQFGALHAIVGYQSIGVTEPGIVVMPTGTGKTETMLAWLIAERPEKVLVLVPSVALREQIATRFEALGILQREGIVTPSALRPAVARLEHGLQEVEDARALTDLSNVVVATPQALSRCSAPALAVLLEGFTHLIVDEAHHSAATTWNQIVAAFSDRPVLLFTATPFRADGRALPGRTIFRFPLREAQKDGDYSEFDFAMVPSLGDEDRDLAVAALGRLRSDHAAGLDHVLLARVDTKVRAEEVAALYAQLGPELNPHFLHDTLSRRRISEALKGLRDGDCRVVVCVDMLGEGFDLPNLKVAAIHNPRRTLSPMIQLIGRLARTSAPTRIGRASVFVKQDLHSFHSPIRDLLREDPDWNRLLSDVSEYATTRAEAISEFDSSFADTPANVPAALLEPKMSAVAFRANDQDWSPDNARAVYGERILDDIVSVSSDDTLAWFVLATHTDPRWGNITELSSVVYDLVIMYLDRDHGVLFVHGSDTKKKYEDLARAVLRSDPIQFKGFNAFRVFGGLDRIVPTNVGLLDSRDRDKRFSMYVGSSVLEALTEAEKQNKSNTHVAANALENGQRVNISAALSGRFWSMQSAHGLTEWRDWCHRQGAKLIDTSVNPSLLFRDMIIPEPVEERPAYSLLAVEWPWSLYLGTGTALRATLGGVTYPLLDLGFEVQDHGITGPFQFAVVSESWRATYVGNVSQRGIHYIATGNDVMLEGRRGEATQLSDWLNDHKPTLILSEDRLISGDDRLYAPRTDLAPYSRSNLKALDWSGVDITVESQGIGRRPDSIQAFMVRHLLSEWAFDVLVDDDRSGEAADLVGLRVVKDTLIITLVHCKYSSNTLPGGRLADLYEVSGQAIRGARWRDHSGEPLLTHLDRRARQRARLGHDVFEVGDLHALTRIRERARYLRPTFHTLIGQPGLSIQASTDEQMRLLAGAESYVRSVTKGSFSVYCSV